MTHRPFLPSVAVVLLLAACSGVGTAGDGGAGGGGGSGGGAGGGAAGGGDGGTHPCTSAELAALEAALGSALDQAATDPSITATPDHTLLLERSDGRTFSHAYGASSPTTVYESASTSKWVTAAVILRLVDDGKLSLDSRASDSMPTFWTETSVTLRHLLSFRSGFSAEPLCINLGAADFRTCVQAIYTQNAATAKAPGTEFFYSSTHLQVAGLMAMRSLSATATWADVFADFKARTGLFPTAVYDLPSATNPRLAGGMHWTAQEYFDFLRALTRGTLLSSSTRTAMLGNQRGTATVGASPALDLVNEDWAYGFGNWLECPTAKGANTFDCGAGHRNSSPGAYGAYPFIDFDHGYFGILARQGTLGSFREGLKMFRAVESQVRTWAQGQCPP